MERTHTPRLYASRNDDKKLRSAKVPFFGGDVKRDININQWIFLMKLHFDQQGIPENRQAMLSATYLRDLALDVFKNLYKDHVAPTWKTLKEELKKNFQAEDIDKKAREELLNLRQHGDNFQEYLRKFHQSINQIHEIMEEE